MHPNDMYDFLADNGADPWKQEPLTREFLIDKMWEFVETSPDNAGLLEEWNAHYCL
jgi:hypothetical protein